MSLKNEKNLEQNLEGKIKIKKIIFFISNNTGYTFKIPVAPRNSTSKVSEQILGSPENLTQNR
jgi:hypothetical protein